MSKNSEKLALLASLTHLVAYTFYNYAALKGVSEPNLVPWAIWGLMAVLNTFTYRLQTGDKIKAMLPLAGSVAAIATFGVALVMGGTFREIGTTNTIALVIGIIAVLVWKFGSPKHANYCVLVAVTAGFIPFFKILWVNPAAESTLPWILWSLSTSMNVVVVRMRYKGERSDFVMPVVMMVLHVATLLLTLR